MKFVDETEIYIEAGRGGDGMASYRQARNRPKLGPDGGNGGNGGDVFLVASSGLNTLGSLRYKRVYQAEPGGKGGSNEKTGRCGSAKLIIVPCGTVVRDSSSGELVGELIADGSRLLVAQGGRRGYGNAYFTSPTNRCPQFSTQGGKGEQRKLALSLKLLADVGLAGLPNAGKSTLLSRVSAASPKIGNYPFTTLTPSLGVVDMVHDFEKSFVMADIPGLVSGASEGRGLGYRFLKHLERTRLILYVIDPFSPEYSVEEAYETLRHELTEYSPELAGRKSLVFLTKLDLQQGDEENRLELARKWCQRKGLEFFEGSAVTGEGLKSLCFRLAECLTEASEELSESEESESVLTV